MSSRHRSSNEIDTKSVVIPPKICLKPSSFIEQDGRIPLHYAAASPKAMTLYSALTGAGSDATTKDNKDKAVQVGQDGSYQVSLVV